MAGRPKAVVDVALIRKLHDQGLSAREIAKRVNFSRMTINRILCQFGVAQNRVAQNSSNVVVSGTKSSGTKLAQNSSSDVKRVKPPQKITPLAPTYSKPTTTAPASPSARASVPITRTTPRPLGAAHHNAYSIAYSGIQPITSTTSVYGRGGKAEIQYVDALDYHSSCRAAGFRNDNTSSFPACSGGSYPV